MDGPLLPPPWDDESRATARLRDTLGSLNWSAVSARATPWLNHLRQHPPAFWAMDSLLQAYPLSSRQGLALMRLAEALLRVPDAETTRLLLSDQLAHGEFSHPPPVRHSAHPWWEALSHKVLSLATRWMHEHIRHPSVPADGDWGSALQGVIERLGQDATVHATLQAVQLLGRQFVLAPRMEEALKVAAHRTERDRTHACTTGWSFDMLGEGARTWADADRYLAAYEHALQCLAHAGAWAQGQGVSIKLSALHPRFEDQHGSEVIRELLPRLAPLAALAARHQLLLTLDAEESDRLALQLRVLQALMEHWGAQDDVQSDAQAAPWSGLGLAVQAYQLRAPAVIGEVIALARHHRRRLTVRLVKGAYWDGEIKRAQELGLPGYPVYTRKAHTDLAYLACARQLLQHVALVRPQFATHNAITVAAVMQLAQDLRVAPADYEWQRLHGMGEATYDCIRQHTPSSEMAAVRIYAPVGPHRDLLAYLVRRLLENGANSSFVHQLADTATPLEKLLQSPLLPSVSPSLPTPCMAWGGPHPQAPGRDLSHLPHRQSLESAWQQAQARHALAPPRSAWVTSAQQVDGVMQTLHTHWPDWEARLWDDRAQVLTRVADQLTQDLDGWAADLVTEAHKTFDDAVAEVRETIDLARFYADQARRLGPGQALPGPTGELNRWQPRGRGVFVCIAPWNFPLAIFGGQVMAALVTGNAVAAKSAPQTPAIGDRLVRLLHLCGVPTGVLQHVPGDGDTGAALVAHRACAGVAFTGSSATAKQIQRILANGPGPLVPLIAETGGLNAMVVDSSALPEQVVDSVIHSAFHSAGQRCSALRLLCLHTAVAEDMERMLAGAMHTLHVGTPWDWRTDVGPVIDAAAATRLHQWTTTLKAWAQEPDRQVVCLGQAPSAATGIHDHADGMHWVTPSAWRLPSVDTLTAEHFGPILHVVHWGPGTSAPDLATLLAQINAQGYGLTMGLHTRMDTRMDEVSRLARVGNLYVNRGMTGAVVGAQPFGGQGWSGTGPKAGGPWYLHRFTTEQVVSVNTTAAGGNATLLAQLTR
jgi:RHH-type transcriptional regulator, proline utilization regulon repressor / proline dehydrogenase / delta 1-pyrroline-5-carboxylate dehydrogenase